MAKFGSEDKFDNIEKMCHTAFDLGVNHFDLANNYGPYPGAAEEGIGLAVFSPLQSGILTDKYLHGIPKDSRIGKGNIFLKEEAITSELQNKVSKLNEIAKDRGQTLAQMALSWVLREGKVATVLVGASKPEQITDSVESVYKIEFTPEQLIEIEEVLKK